MTDERFYKILTDAFDSRPDFYPFDIDYDFTSGKISRKTRKYVKRINSEVFCSPAKPQRARRFSMRYVAAVIVGASVFTALAIGTIGYVSKFSLVEDDDKMACVSTEFEGNAKTSIEEVYEITYDLNGYKQTRFDVDEFDVWTIYETDSDDISFMQRSTNAGDLSVNIEGAIIESVVVNDEEAIYIDSSNEYGDSQHLIWTYDGYEFYIGCEAFPQERIVSKNQMIEMAEAIEIKK